MLVAKMHDYIPIFRGLENKVADAEVVEEFDPRPNKPVVFKVMLEKCRNISERAKYRMRHQEHRVAMYKVTWGPHPGMPKKPMDNSNTGQSTRQPCKKNSQHGDHG